VQKPPRVREQFADGSSAKSSASTLETLRVARWKNQVGVDEFLDEMLFGVVAGGESFEPGGFERF